METREFFERMIASYNRNTGIKATGLAPYHYCYAIRDNIL